MKHVILTLGVFSLGFLMSCDNSVEKETQENVEQQEHQDEHDHEHEEEMESDNVSEDNGEKWKVNEEMKPYVMQGQGFVTAYSDSGDEDYKSLAVNLAEQNDQLIASCTMGGKSHDELHKWLLPHIELTKKLQNTSHLDEANYIVSKLLESYGMYHKYFQ